MDAIFAVFIAPVLIGMLLYGVLFMFGISFAHVGKKYVYSESTDENNRNPSEEKHGSIFIKILFWFVGFIILVAIVGAMGSVGFPAMIVALFFIFKIFF